MIDLLTTLSVLGRESVGVLWLPLLMWTAASLPLYLTARYLPGLHPETRYHGLRALLLSLPLGLFLLPAAPEFRVVSIAPAVAGLHVGTVGLESQAVSPALEFPVREVPFDLFVIVGTMTLLAAALAALCLGRLGVQAVGMRYFRATLCNDPRTRTLLDELTTYVGIRRHVRLQITTRSLAPMTYGWRRPAIVIPQSLIGDSHALRASLVHELVHVRRHDYALGWVERCVKALFVVHPLVVLLEREIKTYREISCDAEVMRLGGVDAGGYARLLLRFASPSPAALSMAPHRSTLRQRIEAMPDHMNRKERPSSIAAKGLLFISLVAIPALFAACQWVPKPDTDQISTDVVRIDIEKLSAEVAYLQSEIDSLSYVIELGGALDPAIAKEEKIRQRIAAERALHRRELLKGMLQERMRTYEEARMEAATAEWVRADKSTVR